MKPRGQTGKFVCRCGATFEARLADRARGWAKSCSKSCAATLREKKTGNYAKYIQLQRQRERDEEEGFADAHLFSNEDFDCNK